VIAAPRKLAGKRVACPACKKPITLPASPAAPDAKATPAQRPTPAPSTPIDDLLEEVGVTKSKTGKRCPKCRQDMSPDAILCIECGYHLELGKHLRGYKR
jgi:hypothetical protein